MTFRENGYFGYFCLPNDAVAYLNTLFPSRKMADLDLEFLKWAWQQTQNEDKIFIFIFHSAENPKYWAEHRLDAA